MPKVSRTSSRKGRRKVRYAVVGLGHIAQVAALPAFAHAQRNSELVGLVSGSRTKLAALGDRYSVAHRCGYDEFDDLMASGDVDAVYIALPNDQHRDFAVRAARAGVHVLCEKPMAVTEAECEAMLRAAERGNAKLMIAYRLHFERANLGAIALARAGKLGELRLFDSVFTMQVAPGNIRLRPLAAGGGTLFDIGIYCLNAARYLFGAEPDEVYARVVRGTEKRFRDADEMTAAVLHFPGDRLATFTSSFGAAPQAAYELVGTKGRLRLESAYEYRETMTQTVVIDERQRRRSYPVRDQFAPEFLYFSDCILHDRQPEPSGREGLADVRIIRALYRSAERGKAIRIEKFSKPRRPSMRQQIYRPPVSKPDLVGVAGASQD